MRIYELSKKLGIPNKELVDFLKQNGVEIASHMSVLSEDAIRIATTHFANTSTPQKVQEQLSETTSQLEEIATPKNAEVIPPKMQTPSTPTPPASVSTSQQSMTKDILITPMTMGELAIKLSRPVNEVMLTLLKQGILSNKNQVLQPKVIEQLVSYYQFNPVYPSAKLKEKTEHVTIHEKTSQGTHQRLPVVVVVGHVDHGKTTLLDYIRKTKVAAKEQGGITQHLGAYQVKTDHGALVFLDTPGHAAFIKMRARGVKVADIVILVVAADDGVMPQTVEAIKHAKTLKVPIIVAINKVDKATPLQIEAVKRGLTQYDLLPEEWGGQTICVPISGKTGQGVDQLLEMIQLQAEVMELRTETNKPARGFVLEARMEKGRGSVATVLTYEGTLKVGDYFIAGSTYGKINSLTDSYGKKVKSVGPSSPVQIAGFEELPDAGDSFEIVPQARYQQVRSKGASKDSTTQMSGEGTINLIVKVDTKSSKEAILEAIEQLSTKATKKFHVIYSGIGDISESDVELAHTTGASIVAFHVKFELNANSLAQKLDVKINTFHVIYKLLDELEVLSKEQEPVKLIASKVGTAVVRKVFEIKNLGTIAGSYIRDGRFVRNGRVVVWRGKTKVGEGPIKSLERDRKSVKEVHTGFECAFLVDGFNDWQVDDSVECFVDVPQK